MVLAHRRVILIILALLSTVIWKASAWAGAVSARSSASTRHLRHRQHRLVLLAYVCFAVIGDEIVHLLVNLLTKHLCGEAALITLTEVVVAVQVECIRRLVVEVLVIIQVLQIVRRLRIVQIVLIFLDWAAILNFWLLSLSLVALVLEQLRHLIHQMACLRFVILQLLLT